ncbi:MAG TPA: ABATE domain-containing protein [Ktedonobacteraceae bacterium]|nr:ABATE domain-containing protein [Ktedonobacteraceae bacterium]
MMNGQEYFQEAMQRMPPLIGERLCLDFVNTIEPRGDPYISEQERATQREYLTNYSDFLAWGILAGIVTEEEANHLHKQAMREESQTDETLKQIIALRERLYAIFWSIASSQQVQEQELTWLRQTYLDTLSHARLIQAEGHYIWQWTIGKAHLISPIWPIVQSALELLTIGDLTRIKLCPGAPGASLACAWLFYDESKNRSRHWCSMNDCGSRTKALRLTERRRIRRKRVLS